jgi:hypothetical protein
MSGVIDGLEIRLHVDPVINRAQVTVYPVEVAGTPQVLWQAQAVLRLSPGQTRVIYALFRDADGNRCGAASVVTPVAGTDYAVYDTPEGAGVDYTSDPAFDIDTVTEATRMQITLTNDASGPLYVRLLQVRGQPLLVYDPITLEAGDAASQEAYEVRAAVLDLPMQPDPVFGQSYADFLVARRKDPVLAADRLVVRDRDAIGVNVFSLALMDRVVITDFATGLDAAAHRVRAVDYELAGGTFAVTLYLEPADTPVVWLLGTSGYGELDSATRLGL